MHSRKNERVSTPYQSGDFFITAIFFLAITSTIRIFNQFSYIHYAVYAMPPLFVFLWISVPSRRVALRNYSTRELRYVILMALSFIFPIILSTGMALQYTIFMLGGFIPFIFPMKISDAAINRLFQMLTISQVLISFLSGFKIRSADVSSFSEGSAAISDMIPVMFGIFMGYYISNKKKPYILICLMMIFLSGKRSVLGASLIGSIMHYAIVRMFRQRGEVNIPAYALITSIVAGFIFSGFLPFVYSYVADYYGLNVDILTSGRQVGQAFAYDELYHSSALELLFGHGLGRADEYALIGFGGLASLIHSDYLRIAIDFGIISGAMYCISYMNLVGRGRMGVYLVYFSLYIWLTENNSINLASFVLIYMCKMNLNSNLDLTKKPVLSVRNN